MRKCDFNKVALAALFEILLRHGCSPVNLLHIFKTTFTKNTSERLLLGLDNCIDYSKIPVYVVNTRT